MNDSIAIDERDLGRVGMLLHVLRTCFHWLALTLGYVVLTTLTIVMLQSGCQWAVSPERQDKTRALASFPSDFQVPRWSGQAADFDGDGVPDELCADWYHVETLFGRGPSGMVYVKSGKTGDVILAHAKGAPFLSGGWYADYDGDGLTDVVLHVHGGWTVYGFDGGDR